MNLTSPSFSTQIVHISPAGGEEVARAGLDSVVFDLSALPFNENICDIGSGSETHEMMPDPFVPYKILPPVVESAKELVESRLRLFNDPALDEKMA
jgi:hypothetical protein